MSLRVGDRVRLKRGDDWLMIEAEVTQTPAGEGDVWGFRDVERGCEIYTNEPFTAHVLRQAGQLA